ncbi:hypothetical protein BDA96_01G514900 [Sorghum bicolor]|uniref:Uncharacterized protein n=1 Tax=Sorghum bicolor TaxID=4558 RepID=A0A921S727_SORBI|nr:hypothetical protein BDA96_01G514900 [Sorghum bicolor]
MKHSAAALAPPHRQRYTAPPPCASPTADASPSLPLLQPGLPPASALPLWSTTVEATGAGEIQATLAAADPRDRPAPAAWTGEQGGRGPASRAGADRRAGADQRAGETSTEICVVERGEGKWCERENLADARRGRRVQRRPPAPDAGRRRRRRRRRSPVVAGRARERPHAG